MYIKKEKNLPDFYDCYYLQKKIAELIRENEWNDTWRVSVQKDSISLIGTRRIKIKQEKVMDSIRRNGSLEDQLSFTLAKVNLMYYGVRTDGGKVNFESVSSLLSTDTMVLSDHDKRLKMRLSQALNESHWEERLPEILEEA